MLRCLQSICVVESLEFRLLCLTLHPTLTDSEIPYCDKMRESIIYHWKRAFRALKEELSVSLCVLPSPFLLANFDR